MALTTNNFTWGQTGAWDNSPATNGYWNPLAGNTNTPVAPTEHLIQGQMVTATYSISQMESTSLAVNANPNIVKEHLCKLLAEQLMKANCIEFTKQEDMLSNGVSFRARIYAVPDTQVKVLREYNK